MEFLNYTYLQKMQVVEVFQCRVPEIINTFLDKHY